MQKLELYSRRRALVTGNQVTEFSQDVRADFDHVFVTRWSLQGLLIR